MKQLTRILKLNSFPHSQVKFLSKLLGTSLSFPNDTENFDLPFKDKHYLNASEKIDGNG